MKKLYLFFYFYHCVFTYKYLLLRIAEDKQNNENTTGKRVDLVFFSD